MKTPKNNAVLFGFKPFFIPFKTFLRQLLSHCSCLLDAQLIEYLDELAVEWFVGTDRF